MLCKLLNRKKTVRTELPETEKKNCNIPNALSLNLHSEEIFFEKKYRCVFHTLE